MDKQKILIYFSKLNELLAGDGVELEFFVNGGANMCLYMQTREATHDIDVSTRGMDLDGGHESAVKMFYPTLLDEPSTESFISKKETEKRI